MQELPPFPHRYIAIEGNIGAGKTTLSTKIAEDFGTKLILEQFSDNPFLPFFYENPDRYAFTVELFFMTERHKQLQTELAQQDLFQQSIVADYFFLKTLLFAKNNLSEEEYRLFQRLFHILNANFPKPELLMYLHRPVEDLLGNIRRRGRTYEQEIEAVYLQQIQQSYFEFFKNETNLPILVVNLGDADFLHNQAHYQYLIDLLKGQYTPGLHHFTMEVPD